MIPVPQSEKILGPCVIGEEGRAKSIGGTLVSGFCRRLFRWPRNGPREREQLRWRAREPFRWREREQLRWRAREQKLRNGTAARRPPPPHPHPTPANPARRQLLQQRPDRLRVLVGFFFVERDHYLVPANHLLVRESLGGILWHARQPYRNKLVAANGLVARTTSTESETPPKSIAALVRRPTRVGESRTWARACALRSGLDIFAPEPAAKWDAKEAVLRFFYDGHHRQVQVMVRVTTLEIVEFVGK